MKRGKFISIEGTEGAGKSTALQFIKNYLTEQQIDVVLTREPGGTELAEQIRNILLHPLSFEEMTSETELLLMFAARAQHMQKNILPALKADKWVVTDRFIDASYAYQGGGRQLADEKIKILDDWIVGDVYPDLTLLLDITPEIGFARAEKRGTAKDRIEEEKIEFFTVVRNKYLERAEKDPNRIKIIHAGESLFAVEKQIRDVLDEFMRKK